MQTQRYQQLNPAALAIAAGSVAFIGSIVLRVGIMGMTGMMGGYGHGGAMDGNQGMMGSYGNMWGGISTGYVVAGVIVWALLAALLGATFAWIYNALNARAGS